MLDEQTAALILRKMKNKKAAAVMAQMEPKKAAMLTEGIINIEKNFPPGKIFSPSPGRPWPECPHQCSVHSSLYEPKGSAQGLEDGRQLPVLSFCLAPLAAELAQKQSIVRQA